MAQIQPLIFPILGTATTMNVLVLGFSTDATTCTVYYELITDDKVKCIDGNYTLTEQEYDGWGSDNSYVDNVVANYLGITII